MEELPTLQRSRRAAPRAKVVVTTHMGLVLTVKRVFMYTPVKVYNESEDVINRLVQAISIDLLNSMALTGTYVSRNSVNNIGKYVLPYIMTTGTGRYCNTSCLNARDVLWDSFRNPKGQLIGNRLV